MRQQSTTDKTTQNGFEGIKRSEEEEKNEKLAACRFAWFAPFALLGLHIIETCNEGGGDFVYFSS